LLNEHSNAAIHKYTDTAQLLYGGRKAETMYNIFKLITNILAKLKPQFTLSNNNTASNNNLRFMPFYMEVMTGNTVQYK
jgi:hypothetical protein